MVLDNANTAVVVSEISQPNVAIQLRAAAETERPRAVRHGEHGDVGGEPGPKQTGRRALTLLFGYGVDTLLLDGEGPLLIAHVKLISLNLPSNAAGKPHARRVSAIVHMI